MSKSWRAANDRSSDPSPRRLAYERRRTRGRISERDDEAKDDDAAPDLEETATLRTR